MKAEELKRKARHELIEYAVNVVYLAVVFAAFTVYRRLILASYDITYTNYGVAVIEALIPFFAFKKLGRVAGRERLKDIFFLRRHDLANRWEAKP